MPLLRLLTKGVLLLLLLGLTLGGFVLLVFDGQTDPYYLRLTTPRAPSLVLGTSRAAQGVIPSVINASDLSFARPLYNFSFTEQHTPYGPYYLRLLKKKLAPSDREGLFIVAVDPWSISCEPRESPEDETRWREANAFIGRIWNASINPNLEYALRYYEQPLYKALLPSQTEIQADGWLRVDIPMDSATVRERINEKIARYRRNVARWQHAPRRYDYLDSTIAHLAAFGEVHLVRLPVAPEMYELERQFMPSFDSLMAAAAGRHGVHYQNFIEMSAEYGTTDGNHLDRNSAVRMSEEIVRSIRQSVKNGDPPSR